MYRCTNTLLSRTCSLGRSKQVWETCRLTCGESNSCVRVLSTCQTKHNHRPAPKPNIRCGSTNARSLWTLPYTGQTKCTHPQLILQHSYSTGLPEHYRIALPALSPTMQMGTLVRWTKAEGDQLNEGDLLAEIETDKATMGFETPEEGYLAKILIPEGTKDVAIGKLVCIIVSEASDIAAFKDFVPSDDDMASASSPGPPSSSSATPTAPASAAQANLPEHFSVKLPALSPTMEKGSVKEWQKQEGDELNEGDVLVQIETDKATMDFETPEEGYLARVLIPSNTKDVTVGAMLCVIVSNKDDIAAFKDYVPTADTAASPAAAPAPTPLPQPAAPQQPTPTPATPSPVRAPGPSAAPVRGSKVAATPYAKTLAAQKGIDLSQVQGSGPYGEVRVKDIESFVPAAPSATPPVRSATDTYTDLPTSTMRQVIARRLTESKQTIPHYYLSVELNVDNILRLRKELNSLLSKDGIKISVNDFVIKAAALASCIIPEANSSWQESFIRQFNTVDMCVAVATDAGLITPIVFGAEKKGLASINKEVSSLAVRAREGKLQPHEFQGGTFTISNLGMFGVKNFSAIINPPQACTLAVGGVMEQVIVDEDSNNGYRTASVMSVTLSCDHRVVDGAVGAQWLAKFKNFIEKPDTMLL